MDLTVAVTQDTPGISVIKVLIDLLSLVPLSAIFQLYHGDQF
jgi:hypothetical protein